MDKKTFFILIFITFLGLFLHFYKINQSPPCINADEAAFAYNSYSILKTGKDEFGKFLPIRFKSFSDYKMPLLFYLNLPFIYFFGLNIWSIKLINAAILLFFPWLIFFFTTYIFKNKHIALLSSFLFVISWAAQSMTRQLHEAFLTSFLITLTSYFFLLFKDKKNVRYQFLFFISLLLSLFSYQSSRIFGLMFLFLTIFYNLKKQLNKKFTLGIILILLLFFVTDLIYKPNRVINLFFLNNPGLSLKINELRGEGGSKIIYNKLTVGLKERIFEYLKYFSPQFLVINGDENYRFGFPQFLSIITPIEYFFFIAGLYYLFKNKEKNRYYILTLMMTAPIAGSLTWANPSLPRTFFIIIPILMITSYGFLNFIKKIKGQKYFLILLLVTVIYIFFLFYNWNFYINHYPKKAISINAWQCGYKQLTDYIKNNYQKFNKFYITKESGPPYIFLLFFLKYPPNEYQKQANSGPIDEYGFSQSEKFDKFIFNLDYNPSEKNIVVIGRPHNFKEEKNLKKIIINNESLFYIKEILGDQENNDVIKSMNKDW